MKTFNHCFIQFLTFILFTVSWFVQAGEVFGTFTIDGSLATSGTVTLYDRNFNAIDSVSTTETGQYRILYPDPDLYYLSGVQGLATTGFHEMALGNGETNLDLNVLVSNKTITIKGQVTTEAGYPISFAALQFGSEVGKLNHRRVYSDKFGFYELQLEMPSFVLNLTLDAWLGNGLSTLTKDGEELTVLSDKQHFQITLEKEQLALDYTVKMPAFAKQTIQLTSLDDKPIQNVVTTIYQDDSGQLLRLSEYNSDGQGQVSFFYPVINGLEENQTTHLTVRTEPANSFTGDYKVEWLADVVDDHFIITYDKRRNSANGIGTTITGHVDVIGEDDTTYRTEATVSVMDADFNLVEEVVTSFDGFYSISLDHWSDYYLRAETEHGKSPWRKVKARQDEVEYSILLNTQQNVIDIAGTLQTQGGKTLGRVALDFSTSALPTSIYRMGDSSDPRVVTNQSGDYVISVVGNSETNDADIEYDVTIADPGRRIYVDGLYQSSYLSTPEIRLSLNTVSIEAADIVLPEVSVLNLKTFAPDAKPYALDIDIYQVLAEQERFLLRVNTVNGDETINLPTNQQDGTPAVYRIRPQVPAALKDVWLPPQIADFNLVGDLDLVLPMLKQGEAEQHAITVFGQVTDLNGLVLSGMDIGFTTTDIIPADYTRAYDGYYPHQLTSTNGEYAVRLRVNEGQATTYTAINRIRDNAAQDQWARVKNNDRWFELWLGNSALNQPLILPDSAENNQMLHPVKLPAAYRLVQLTVKNDSGSTLSNIPITLYYIDFDGIKHTITNVKSNSLGQVEIYLPDIQSQAENITGYQFKLSPVSNDNVTMTGHNIDFNVTGEDLVLDGKVTIEEKRYVTVSGIVTDSNGLPLRDLSMGIRSDSGSFGYDSDITNILGEYTFRLRAAIDEVTGFVMKNNANSSNEWRWTHLDYFDYWAKVSDATGHHLAWAKGVQLSTPVAIPIDVSAFSAGTQPLDVALRKVNLTVTSDQGDVQAGTTVEFHFKNTQGLWTHLKTLTTNSDGVASIYLSPLVDDSELYRFVTKPVSSSTSGVHTVRKGQSTEFDVDGAQGSLEISSTVTITTQERRYVDITGQVTDEGGLPLGGLTMGIRNEGGNDWYDSGVTALAGQYSFTLEAAVDGQTHYDLKNHSYPSYAPFWKQDRYYDDWAKVSDSSGHHQAWLKGERLLDLVVVPAEDGDVVADVVMPVTLKKASLIVSSEFEGVQVNTKVDVHFRDRFGTWSLLKTLSTNAEGVVSIYLPTLSEISELYRFTTTPVNSTDSEGHTIRQGASHEFTIGNGDADIDIESNVIAIFKPRRYIGVTGQVTDQSGVLLQELNLGIRHEGSNDWYDSGVTTLAGQYSFTLEAAVDGQTRYDLKNHSYPSYAPYWLQDRYYDDWAKVSDSSGHHQAWLKGERLLHTVVVPTGGDAVVADAVMPVTLQKVSLMVSSELEGKQANTKVDVHFRDRFGTWLLLKTLTTNDDGIVSIYLPTLNEISELYRFTTKPVNSTDNDGHIIRQGASHEFTIGESDVGIDIESSVVVTFKPRRYIGVTGKVTDQSGVLLQELNLGIRHEGSNDWYDSGVTTLAGQYSFTLEAAVDGQTRYDLKNHSYPSYAPYWAQNHYYDEWAKVSDSSGHHQAWLKEERLLHTVVVPTGDGAVVADVVMPVTLKKASLMVSSELEGIQVNTKVNVHFRDRFGIWSLLTTLTTNDNGVVSIYLPALKDEVEGYRFITKPLNSSTDDGYIFREGQTHEFTIDGSEVNLELFSTVTVTVKPRRYIGVTGQVTDQGGLLLQELNLGIRHEGSNEWYDSDVTTLAGQYSFTLEAAVDAQTRYDLKNHSYPSYAPFWTQDRYYDDWAKVSDSSGHHQAWLKGERLLDLVVVPAEDGDVVADVVMPVTLKKASLTVSNEFEGVQANTKVDVHFRDRFGTWSLLKTLSTNAEGVVSIYLPTLSEISELYRFTTKPVNSTDSDGHIIRQGGSHEFTIGDGDVDIESSVIVTFKPRRYIGVTGQVIDQGGLLLQELNLGIRHEGSNEWYDSGVTTLAGQYSFTLEAAVDVQTRYDLKNHSYPSYAPYWTQDRYYDDWAKVSDSSGHHQAWLKGERLLHSVVVPAGDGAVVADVVMPVTLKKASLIVSSEFEGAQVNTKVDVHFRDRFGTWSLLKTLTTNAEGVVSIYLPALSEISELYRFTTKPVNSTNNEGHIIRQGASHEFTIDDGDASIDIESAVIATFKPRRYIGITGQVTDQSGVLLQELNLGIRHEGSNDWYDSGITTLAGQYSFTLEAAVDTQTRYDLKNHSYPSYAPYWTQDRYYDNWAKVSDSSGHHQAWLKGERLLDLVVVPAEGGAVVADVVMPVTLKKASLTVSNEFEGVQASTKVDVHFRDRFGTWSLLKTLTTNAEGVVSIYLPALSEISELYRFTTKPVNSTNNEGHIIRQGASHEFTIDDGDASIDIESAVIATFKPRRYIGITGQVTDQSGVLLQELNLGIRHEGSNEWYDSDVTTLAGQYSFTLEAAVGAQTRYDLKNHSYPSYGPYWNQNQYYDDWAKVSDSSGHHQAWLKGERLLHTVMVPAGEGAVVADVVMPVTLKKASLTVGSEFEGEQVNTKVDVHFRDRFGTWSLLKTLTTNGEGVVSVYLPTLSEISELYRFTTKPVNSTNNEGHIIRQGASHEFTIGDGDVDIDIESAVIIIFKPRRYIAVTGQVTDHSGVLLQELNLGIRHEGSNEWYDSGVTTLAGQYSFTLEAAVDAQTRYDLKNHSYPSYAPYWTQDRYYDGWAKVSDSSGHYQAWLKGERLLHTVVVPADSGAVVADVVMPVTLKKANLTVSSEVEGAQVNTKVDIHFRDRFGIWSLLKTLTTNDEGVVSVYLPTLSEISELYRFTTKPVNSTDSDGHTIRQGASHEFTIGDGDVDINIESTVIVSFNPRRYIGIIGQVTDLSGVLLQELNLGIRHEGSNEWYDSGVTTLAGQYSFTLEAAVDTQTRYDLKNHSYPSYAPYWTQARYYDDWATVSDSSGDHQAWLKGERLLHTVVVPIEGDVMVADVVMPVTLKKANLTVSSEVEGAQVNTKVDVHFRDRFGTWSLLKTLATNGEGVISIYLPTLSEISELYRFTTKPVNSTDNDGHTIREGASHEFTIGDGDVNIDIESAVIVTFKPRRYIGVTGQVTDESGVLLQELNLGIRHDGSNEWYDSGVTTLAGQYGFTLEAAVDGQTRYGLKNHSYPSYAPYWTQARYYDDWAKVSDSSGHHQAWLKGERLLHTVVVPAGESAVVADVVMPVTLKKASLTVSSELEGVQVNTKVDVHFRDRFGTWSLLQTLTTNTDGVVSIYLPTLSESSELYRFITKPINSTTTNAHTFREGETHEFTISDSDTSIEIPSTVIVTVKDRRYVNVVGQITDQSGLLLRDLSMGIRTNPASLFDVWFDTDTTNALGQYNFQLEASENELANYSVKNNGSPSNSTNWVRSTNFDYWASVEDETGSYEAWLRSINLDGDLEISAAPARLAPFEEFTFNLVAPIELFKFTVQAKDKNGYPLTGVAVDYDFFNAYGDKSDLKNATIGSSGEYALYLPDLINDVERYEITITDNGFYGFEQSTIPVYDLGQTKNQLNILNFTDDQAPRFVSNPYVSYRSDVSALIVWFTDEPAKSSVEVDGQTFTSNALTKRHSVQVAGLTPGQSYTATTKSADASNNESLLNQVTFATLLEVDTANPVFTNAPVLSQVGADIAVVDFSADEPVTAVVKVKDGSTLVSEVTVDEPSSNHQITLEGLYPLSTYQVEVTITDARENGPVSAAPLSLITKENTDHAAPRFTTQPVVRNITSTSVTLYWETDEPAISAISYNLKDGGNHIPLRSEDFNRVHVQTLTGLESNKQYEFTISLMDIFDNGPRLSRKQAFYTRDIADTDAPILLSDVAAIQLGDSSATLVWSTDEAASGVVIYGETADALTETVVAPEPNISQHLALGNLNADTTYFYQLLATDTTGNALTTEVASFTTKSVGSSAPLAYIGLPTLLQVTGESLTVGLRTNKVAHGEVLCYADDGEVHDARSVVENKHQQLIITSLSPASYYQCQVNSWTEAGDRVGSTLLGDTFGSGIVRSLDHRDDTWPVLTANPTVTYRSDKVVVIEWATHELSQTAISYRRSDRARYKAASTAGYRTRHSQIITGLKADTSYKYSLQSQDLAGNRHSEGVYSFTTAAAADEDRPEFVETPVITSIRGGEVSIAFTASEPVTARVKYTRHGSNHIRRLADDNDYRLSHEMVLDFGQGNDYDLNVQIRDLAGNRVSMAQPIILLLKTDSDDDGLNDAFESLYGIDTTSMAADGDEDGDGVTNLEEQNLGLDPTNSDTDGDGISDGDDAFPINPGEVSDSDNDGIGDNDDNLDDQLGQVFIFDETVPNLPADWYFDNVVGTAVNHRGLVSILEYHGGNDLRLKLFNSSDNGRMVTNKQLGGYFGGWQHVTGIEYFDRRWHIIAMHQIDGVNQWYWHKLSENGHYLTYERVKLDGVSAGGGDFKEAIADVQVTTDGLSVLTLIDNQVELRLLDEWGKLLDNFNLLEVDVTSNLHFSQNNAGTFNVVAADNGDCGTVWLYDIRHRAITPQGTIIVSDYQQNRCAVLQDVQVLDNGHILIDAQTELYEVDSSGGLVNQTITNQTGSAARHLASSRGRRYLVSDGVMRQYDSNLKMAANYSAFSPRNGHFVDENFTVHSNPYAVNTHQLWALERNIARVQLFDFNTQAERRFVRSFTLKETNNRLINAQDMVMAQPSGWEEPRLMVLENTDTQVLLHRFTQLGGWGGAVVLPAGFAIATHYQNDQLYILARDSLADTPSSQYNVWQFNLVTNTVDVTLPLASISVKALDITGDGSDLYLLHQNLNNDNQLALARLNDSGELINQRVLERLAVNSAISDRARLSIGDNRLLISYGPQIHLHQLDNAMGFVQVFDQLGYGPMQNALGSNVTAEFTPQGKLVWADTAQGRLQVLKPTLVDINAKAIIVSGGGEYLGNNLWVGTLLNANMAYRALRRQGFAKDRIYYLSNETVDFDGNGQDDELFALASKANLQMAIDWAKDADSLMLYLVDHGNIDNFRVQPTEIIHVDEVANYLDSYTGKLSLIYDACKSGSFMDELQGENRTIITSSNATRDALFLQGGAISFSGLFWQYIDNGQDMYTAYTQSEAFFDRNQFKQDPQVSINGVPDQSELIGRYIGQGYKHAGAEIAIDSVTSSIVDQQIMITAKLSGEVSAVQRVWAIIMPDGGGITDAMTSPVIDVPSIDLTLNEDGTYRGQISALLLHGSQYISVIVQDDKGNKNVPYLSYVAAGTNAAKRAILVAASQNADQRTQVNLQIENAYSALSKQGYSDANIKVLADGFVKADEDSNLDSLDVAINSWAGETEGDLFVYFAGDMDAEQIRLKNEAIDGSTLVSWLDGAMASRGGALTVLLDGNASAGFASSLTGFTEAPVIMAANAPTEFAPWLSNEYFSFSQVFFAHVGQGAQTWDAYVNAKSTFRSWQLAQTPYLDTNDDGESIHKKDGRTLHDRRHTIGRGMLLAGDEPLLGGIQTGLIAGDNDGISLEVSDITTTSELAEVYAYVIHPPIEGEVPVVAKVTLVGDGQGSYSGVYGHIDRFGEYLVQYFARNSEGYISLLTDEVQTGLVIDDRDTDNDGITNSLDTDDDNDGVLDEEDAFPLDAAETTDTDGDGIGNNADDDDDDDGILDVNDSDPLDPDVGEAPTEGLFNLDIDGNGQTKALTDGMLLIRYLFGFRGDILIDGVVSPDATQSTAADIETFIQAGVDDLMLDIDGDGEVRALTDGLLCLRYLFGFTGDVLIDQAVSGEATRVSAAEIEGYLGGL